MFKIAKIEACAVAIPLKMPIKMSGILIETCDNLIVKVTDTDGNVGWGEASSAPTMTGETVEGLVAATKFMANRLEGTEVTSNDMLVSIIEPLMVSNHSAKSAIDGALHDLIGKHLDKPMYEILGGKNRENAPMFWMIAGSSAADSGMINVGDILLSVDGHGVAGFSIEDTVSLIRFSLTTLSRPHS